MSNALNDAQTYRVNWQRPQSIAIALQFDAEQPNHFGAARASAQVVVAGDFIGDTRRGGSCNVATITLTPHCNGTHTESISHIVDQPVAVGQLAQTPIMATLISVRPTLASTTDDAYLPALSEHDSVITKAMLVAELSAIDNDLLEGLIVRTLPNPKSKCQQVYDDNHQPPFFTLDAMQYLVAKGVSHLIVDFPSVDKMYDEGLLTNHHCFWNVAPGSHTLSADSRRDNTITELAYIADTIVDGHYCLSLNIPPFESDAAPCRPLLYPLEFIHEPE
ncbi:MAG: cyclase family protein [Gammaproteobacteria bacterium]|nr:cyclase family protein [Gammaproteobacteria bacterium]